jgi:hypothetical protein
MKKNIFLKINTLTLLMAVLAFGTTSCTEDDTNDPIVEEAVNCQLQSISEISDNEPWNASFTYDANGNVLTRTDDDGTATFTYSGNEIKTIEFDGTLISITYNGGSLPSRLEATEDGETYFFVLESSNNKFTKMETHYLLGSTDILLDVTNITYTADENVQEVTNEEFDLETNSFTESYSIKNISTDDKKNPYATSAAIMIYELLDGNEANLGANNVATATYTFGETTTSVSNTYEYNENDYPTKRVETGFSSPSTYNFTYKCN